ncbi:MAG: hypothetical protein NC299_11105 [Lachnospiraceae bacterium]|nr:hypothetical protein [Ruminococcus sp.]MCM1275895.1 hypothetical protein [Lachnospiraceae bacterium]
MIYAVVLGRLQYWISQAHKKNNSELLERLLKSGNKQRAKETASTKKELSRTEKRLQELDNLFAKMYEDSAAPGHNCRIKKRRFSPYDVAFFPKPCYNR